MDIFEHARWQKAGHILAFDNGITHECARKLDHGSVDDLHAVDMAGLYRITGPEIHHYAVIVKYPLVITPLVKNSPVVASDYEFKALGLVTGAEQIERIDSI